MSANALLNLQKPRKCDFQKNLKLKNNFMFLLGPAREAHAVLASACQLPPRRPLHPRVAIYHIEYSLPGRGEGGR